MNSLVVDPDHLLLSDLCPALYLPTAPVQLWRSTARARDT